MAGRIFSGDQKGSSVAEFAMVALVFFMIIFGIIEFGRLLYTHNALTDAARRGARYAVLHTENDPCVQNVVVYGETHINPATCAPTGPPLINGLMPANIVVQYQGAGPNGYGMNLGTVTVTIQNYAFNLSIPLFRRTLNMPAYTTTLTAESAGEVPPDI
jgi:Flp pilus assembly protein TadG